MSDQLSEVACIQKVTGSNVNQDSDYACEVAVDFDWSLHAYSGD